MICDHVGRLVFYCITTGSVDDRKVLPDLVQSSQLKGKLFGDRALLRKRGIIESLFNLVKSQFDLEHTRH